MFIPGTRVVHTSRVSFVHGRRSLPNHMSHYTRSQRLKDMERVISTLREDKEDYEENRYTKRYPSTAHPHVSPPGSADLRTMIMYADEELQAHGHPRLLYDNSHLSDADILWAILVMVTPGETPADTSWNDNEVIYSHIANLVVKTSMEKVVAYRKEALAVAKKMLTSGLVRNDELNWWATAVNAAFE